MAFTKIAGVKKYFKYSECTQNQPLVADGEYIGSEEGMYGIQHNFKQRDGNIVVLNKAGHLDWLLDNYVKLGQRVNINYAGKSELTKGQFKGKEAHSFELAIEDVPVDAKAPAESVAASDIIDGDIKL